MTRNTSFWPQLTLHDAFSTWRVFPREAWGLCGAWGNTSAFPGFLCSSITLARVEKPCSAVTTCMASLLPGNTTQMCPLPGPGQCIPLSGTGGANHPPSLTLTKGFPQGKASTAPTHCNQWNLLKAHWRTRQPPPPLLELTFPWAKMFSP